MIGHPGGEVGRVEGSHPGSGELEGEWQPVEVPAHGDDRGQVGWPSCRSGRTARARSTNKATAGAVRQADVRSREVAAGQRGWTRSPCIPSRSRLVASTTTPWASAQDGLDERPDSVENVLAVVEHEEQPLGSEEVATESTTPASGLRRTPSDVASAGATAAGLGERGQLAPRDTIGELGRHRGGGRPARRVLPTPPIPVSVTSRASVILAAAARCRPLDRRSSSSLRCSGAWMRRSDGPASTSSTGAGGQSSSGDCRRIAACCARRASGRLQAQLVVEQVPVRGESLQRLGLAAAPVQGEHQLRSGPLAQRVQGRERPQLSHQLGVGPHGEADVEPSFRRHQPQLVQPRRLGGGERLVRELDQRRTAPQAQRLVQDLRLPPWPVLFDSGCVGEQPLEHARVDLLRLHRQQVARRRVTRISPGVGPVGSCKA